MTRRRQIIEVAGRLLEREGPDGLTMRAIAAELDIKAPSLYKHIKDKRELEIALVADGLHQQAEQFEKVLADGGELPHQLATAYRRWALQHPHLYKLMNQQPLPRDDLPDQAEERALAPVLRAFGGDRDRARAAWAFAHGMVTLELAGRFPPNADLATAWNLGIDGIAAQAGLGAGARRTRKDDSND